MEVQTEEARRDRSAALFNNRYFADVAASLLKVSSSGSDMVTTRRVASDTGLSDSVVSPVMKRLVEASVLAKLERTGGPRGPQYYIAKDVQALQTIAQLTDIHAAAQPG